MGGREEERSVRDGEEGGERVDDGVEDEFEDEFGLDLVVRDYLSVETVLEGGEKGEGLIEGVRGTRGREG